MSAFRTFDMTMTKCAVTLQDGTVISLVAPDISGVPLRIGARFYMAMEVVGIDDQPQDASPEQWAARQPQDTP